MRDILFGGAVVDLEVPGRARAAVYELMTVGVACGKSRAQYPGKQKRRPHRYAAATSPPERTRVHMRCQWRIADSFGGSVVRLTPIFVRPSACGRGGVSRAAGHVIDRAPGTRMNHGVTVAGSSAGLRNVGMLWLRYSQAPRRFALGGLTLRAPGAAGACAPHSFFIVLCFAARFFLPWLAFRRGAAFRPADFFALAGLGQGRGG